MDTLRSLHLIISEDLSSLHVKRFNKLYLRQTLVYVSIISNHEFTPVGLDQILIKSGHYLGLCENLELNLSIST